MCQAFNHHIRGGWRKFFHWTSKGSNVHIYEKRTFSYFVTSQYHRLHTTVSFNFLIKFKPHWEIVKKMAEKNSGFSLNYHYFSISQHIVIIQWHYVITVRIYDDRISKIGFSGIFSAQNWVSSKRFIPLHFSIMALLKTQKLGFGSYITRFITSCVCISLYPSGDTSIA